MISMRRFNPLNVVAITAISVFTTAEQNQHNNRFLPHLPKFRTIVLDVVCNGNIYTRDDSAAYPVRATTPLVYNRALKAPIRGRGRMYALRHGVDSELH